MTPATRTRTLIAGIAAALLALIGSAPAAAETPAAEATDAPTVTVSTTVIAVGGTITFSDQWGTCSGTDKVVIALDGTTVATAQGGESWMESVKAPTTPGTYTYDVSCTSTSKTITYAPMSIRVLPPPPENIGASIGEITRDGCTVSVPVTTTGAYTFELQVWDDQTTVQSTIWDTQADGTTVITWTITGAPNSLFDGDIYFEVLVNGSVNLDGRDTRADAELTYSQEVADTCSAKVPVHASIEGDASSLKAGQDLTISGTGLVHGEAVDITLDDSATRIGGQEYTGTHTLLETDDPFTLSATLPADISPGRHALVITGKTSHRTTRILFTVG